MLKKIFNLLPINIQIRLKKRVTLLYRDAGYGDTIMITAVINEIRKAYGSKVQINVNGIKKELLENNPNVTNINKGNWGIDLNYHKTASNLKPEFNILEFMYSRVGIKSKNKSPNIYLTQNELRVAHNITSNYPLPIVTIQTTAGKFSNNRKEWPISEWKTLTKLLTDSGCTVIHLGNKNSPKISNCIDLCGKLTINESIAVIKNADLHIGVVSSLMHGAATVNRAAIILYGGFEKASLIDYPYIISIESDIKCSPCISYNKKIPPCPHNNQCMKEIKDYDIYKIADELLNLRSNSK